MFLLVLTVFFSHFLLGFNAKPAESGVLFRFHLSLFNVNKSVTKVQTFIYADNTAFTERLQCKYSVTLVLPISDFISTFVGGDTVFSREYK